MGYQAIGNICLIKTKDKKIAQKILKDFPQFKSVYYQGEISGKLRLPKLVFLAGEKNSETIHHELGCEFKIDVSKIMWSKGNHEERKRMISAAKKSDVIIDMFAGIGYWSICIAKYKQAKIFAIELNPNSFSYLEQNIRLNRLSTITAIKGDCSKVVPKLGVKADKIIMGYFPHTEKYLPAALTAIKKGGIIYYHDLCKESKEQELFTRLKKKNKQIKLKSWRIIKSYSPGINHIVLELISG